MAIPIRGGNEKRQSQSVLLKHRESAETAIRDAVVALQKIAAELSSQDYAGKDPDRIARTGAYLAKIVDETVRLIEFLDGNPDSRPDLGLGDLLQYLTAEQFEQFQRWVEQGKAKEITIQ